MSLLFPGKKPNPAGPAGDPRLIIAVDYIGEVQDAPGSAPWRGRVNVRAFSILLVLAAVAVAAYFPLADYQGRRMRRAALAQANEYAAGGQADLALIALGHHLRDWPEDVEALELQARLLTEAVRTPDEALAAARVQDHLIRLDPMAPGRQENRRRLVELYIGYADAVARYSKEKNRGVDKFESRYRAAAKIAQQRLAFGADDALAHRLLAMSLEGLAATGDSKALAEATTEYEQALRRDPSDAASAERLALIHLDRRKDAAGAGEILDELIQAAPGSIPARLARYRFYSRTRDDGRARTELEKAAALAPRDLTVRVTAAADALRRRDTASARRHLDAIGPEARGDKRVLVLRGQVELVEQRPDEAIDSWRKGLASAGGTDMDLTWRLAYTLIQLGRFAEARPLLAQYERLSGSEANPMARFLRGFLKQQSGRPTAAIVDLEEARPNLEEGSLAELELVLGRCYEAINDPARAIVGYRRAIEASPMSPGPRRALARLLAATSPDQAAEELEAAIRVIPSDPSLFADLASALLAKQMTLPPRSRDPGVVDAVLKRAARAGVDDRDLLRVRADVLTATGRLDRAIALIEEATRGPARSREDLWLAWASSLLQQGHRDEAARVLDRALGPDGAGDHASLRAARARIHLQAGHARLAREALDADPDRVPAAERAALARARLDLERSLGDMAAAREAGLAWARLAPEDPQPGLTLMALGQSEGGEEASRLGLELLRSIGGEDEPYALAARALDLLGSNRRRAETRSARLDQADQLSRRLQAIAPKLPISYLVRGMVLERSHRIDEAIADYRVALRGNTSEIALERLVELLTRLKRHDDLAGLKASTGLGERIDRLSAEAALRLGDKPWAERALEDLVAAQPDSVEMRAAQARLLAELERPAEADAALRSLALRRPDLPGPWLSLLVFRLSRGPAEAASKTLQEIRAAYKGDRPDLFLARCHWVAGDRAGAARLFDEAVARRPDDPATLRAASEFDEATGRAAEAEARLRKALRLDPSASWASRRLALILARRPDPAARSEAWTVAGLGAPGAGDSPEDRLLRATLEERSPDPARRASAAATLLALIEDLPTAHPASVEARTRLGRIRLEAGDPADAARLVSPLIGEKSPAGPATLAVAVEALARTRRGDEAARLLARLAAQEPESPRTTCCRAWASHAAGNDAEAVALIEGAAESAEKAPDGEGSSLNYLGVLAQLDQPEATERLGRRIAARWPRDAWILARIQAGRGRYPEAVESCRVSLEAGPHLEPLRLLVGWAGAGHLDPPLGDRARGLLDAALAAAPGDRNVRELATILCHLQARFEDEIGLYRKAIELDPADGSSLNNMAWTLGVCLDRPADALKVIDRAIEVAGRTPSACDTRGVLLTRLGRFDEAIVDLEAAVRGGPSAGRHFHLARAYFKAGQPGPHRRSRDLARLARLEPAALDPRDRADFAAVMGP